MRKASFWFVALSSASRMQDGSAPSGVELRLIAGLRRGARWLAAEDNDNALNSADGFSGLVRRPRTQLHL
jgi:hypothetical protein